MSLWMRPDPDAVQAEVDRAAARERALERIETSYRQRRNQATRARTEALAEFSDNVDRWANLAPWMDPGAVVGLSEAGIGPDSGYGRGLATAGLINGGGIHRFTGAATGANPREPAPPGVNTPDPVLNPDQAGGAPQVDPSVPGNLNGVIGRVLAGMSGMEPINRGVAREWDTWLDDPDRVDEHVARFEEVFGWDPARTRSVFAFARDNGIDPGTVIGQLDRTAGSPFGRAAVAQRDVTPDEFFDEALRERPNLGQQAFNATVGTLSTLVSNYQQFGELITPFGDETDRGTELMRGAVRGGLVGLDTGRQHAQATFRNLVSPPEDQSRWEAALQASPLGMAMDLATPGGVERTIETQGRLLGQTDTGIIAERLAAGDDVDIGEGWFPDSYDTDSQIGEIRHRRELEHGTIDGHAISMGRWMADRVFEPDTLPFDIASGFVDAGVAVANPQDVGFGAGWSALRRGRNVSNWRQVDDIVRDQRHVDVENIVSRSVADTDLDGIGTFETMERYLRLPVETRAAMARGDDFAAPGVFGTMTPTDRQTIARYGDEIEALNPDLVSRRKWVSAIDEDTGDEYLLSGGGIRAAAGQSDATADVFVPGLSDYVTRTRSWRTGTFRQASLDEGAAIRWEARHGLGAGDVPDLPTHQLTLDEYMTQVERSVGDNVFVPGSVIDPDDITAQHRRAVAAAVERDDVVPATVLLDHPDLVPPQRLREIVDVDAGILNEAWRPDVELTKFDTYTRTRHGQRTMSAIAETDNTYDVWRLFNRQIPIRLARELADLSDPALVHRTMRRHMGLKIRDLPRRNLSATDRARDALRSGASPLTLKGRVRLAGARHLDNVPHPVVDTQDLDSAVTQMERWMANAGFDDNRIRHVVDRVGRVEHPDEMFGVVEGELADGLRDTLIEMGVHRRNANRLSRMWGDRVAGDRQWATTDSGADITIPRAIGPDGPIESPGPMLESELVQRYIPMPADTRDIRRQLMPFKPLLDNPVSDWSTAAAIGVQQALWKPMVLMRPAWAVRVVGEEQARLAAAGWSSMFRHPLEYLGILSRRRMDEGLAGDPIRLMEEHAESMSRMGGLGRDPSRYAQRDLARIGGFTKLSPRDDGFTQAWANELISLNHDPVARHVHAYGVSDETLSWFMSGGGDQHRRRMLSAIPTLDDPDHARRYLEAISERITHATRHDPELNRLLRTGRLSGPGAEPRVVRNARVRVEGFDRPGKVLEVSDDTALVRHVTPDGDLVELRYGLDEVTPADTPRGLVLGDGDIDINPELIDLLDSYVSRNSSPAWIVGEDARLVTSKKERASQVLDKGFDALGSKPTNKFTRSPVFTQMYWRRSTELFPYMTRDAREQAMRQARDMGVSRRLRREAREQMDVTAPGDLTLARADELARRAAMDDIKKVLFDMTERRQFFDTYRLLFPFGDAWMEVITRWANIVADRPLAVRRLQQGLQTGRNEGWFQEGAFGDEVFSYGPTTWAPGWLGFPKAEMTGRLQGLNLMGEIFPGFGPAVQVPAGWLWGDRADRQEIMEIIAPFGTTDRVQTSLLPPHWRRFFAGFLTDDGQVAQWLPDEVSGVLGGVGDFFGINDEARLQSVAKDVMDHLVMNEGWGHSTPEEMEALLSESQRRASIFLMAQGFAQSTLPTVPLPEWQIESDMGLAMKGEILDEWYERRSEDPDTAMQAMLDRYGEDLWLILQGKTRQVSLNAPITETPLRWVQENPEVVDKFPMVYGLFAPQAEEAEDIDSQAFDRVLATGGRERLTAQQMLWMAQDRMAWNIYSQERDRFGRRLEEHESRYMRDLSNWLETEYPGWGRAIGITERAETEELIREIEDAVQDPAIAQTPAGQGTIAFLEGWYDAVDAGREQSTARIPFGQSQETAWLRTYVRDLADWTIAEHPEFEPVWRMVFERALIDPDEEVAD
ncbi:MAG: hypothetical protein ACLFRV_03900 [Acidimicrobiales bacterium]